MTSSTPIGAAAGVAPIALAADDAAPRAAGAPEERTKDRRIEAVCVGTGDGVCLAASDAGRRLAARGRVLAAMDHAARIGAPMVRLAAARREISEARTEARGTTAPFYEDTYHYALDALTALRFEAGLRGVRLAVDTAADRFLMSPIEARAFFDGVNSPWVGACLDVGACAAYAEPDDWIRTLGHRIAVLAVRAGDAAGLNWPAVERSVAAVWLNVPVLIDPGAPDGEAAAVELFNRLINRSIVRAGG